MGQEARDGGIVENTWNCQMTGLDYCITNEREEK